MSPHCRLVAGNGLNMISSTVRIAAVAFFLALFLWDSSASCGQAVDNSYFKALPRPINYATPLCPQTAPKP